MEIAQKLRKRFKGVTSGISSIRIELNKEGDGKKKISPSGVITGFDGRVFVINEQSIEETKAKGIDIPLNVEHCFTSASCKAVGWFDVETLELRDDGVYASLSLNEEGKELIKNRSYRYLSPEFMVGSDRVVKTIEGVALVNDPNFKLEINRGPHYDNNGVEINKKEKEMEKEDSLQKELNKKEEQIATLKKELNAQKEQNEALVEKLKEFHLSAAIEKNKILPAEKDALKAMPLDSLVAYLQTREPLGMTKQNNSFEDGNQKEENENKLLQEIGWEA